VSDGVAETRPGALVHLAAIAAPSEARKDPDAAWRINLGGTLNLARAVLAAEPACVLLFASSADAYGRSFAAGTPLDETAPLAPLNAYGATKAAADLALGAMVADGLRCIRLRPFNHTGSGQSEAFAVPAFARQIARIEAGLQEPVIHVGALGGSRDFLDVRDVCAAYAEALARADALPQGAILNLASGQTRRMEDVLQDLLRASGVRAEIRIEPSRLRPSEISAASGNASLARRLLDWAPRIPWEQTIRDVLTDWRERVRCA
jgi:nucleoside-diphosphate-sugar epimerase